MDPDATVRRIIAAIEEQDAAEVLDAVEDLLDWTDRAGASPDAEEWFDVAEAVRRWCTHSHAGQGCRRYRVACRLRFSPWALVRGPEGLAQELYDRLEGC